MKRAAIVALLVLLASVLSSCVSTGTKVVCAMDTVSQIKIYADGRKAEALAEEAERILLRLDRAFSASDGDIGRLNGGEVASLSGDAAAVTEKAIYIKELSDGAFDPGLGLLTSLWDIPAKVGTTAEPPDGDAVKDALSRKGRPEVKDGVLTVEGDVSLDLGGIAKGAACEIIVRSMTEGGAAGGIIDLGGNVGVFGKKPDGENVYTVALTSAGEAFAYVKISDAFVSVASSELRYFTDSAGNRYHHILDPGTGYPADSEFLSVAVISRDGAYADALSTAIFVAGWEKALSMRERCGVPFDAVALKKSGEVIYTENNTIITGAVKTAP